MRRTTQVMAWMAVATTMVITDCTCKPPGSDDDDDNDSKPATTEDGGSSGNTSSGGNSSGWVGSSGGTNTSSAGGDGGAGDGSVQPTPLRVDRIFPNAAYHGQDTVVALVGAGFQAGATVRFVNLDDGAQPGGTFDVPGSPDGTGTQLTLTLTTDLARPAGLYRVTVTQGTESVDAPESFRITADPPPTLTEVTPSFAFAGNPADNVLSDRVLSLRGTGFQPGATVEFLRADFAGAVPFEAADTEVGSGTTASATFPSESQRLALGRYFVTLVNPDGQAAQWLIVEALDAGVRVVRGTVEVRNVPPPRITSIAPTRPSPAAASPLTVYGEMFQTGAQVALVAMDGTVCPALTTTPVTGFESSQLTATLNTASPVASCMLTTGATFLVRVTNPDGQFADYAAVHLYSNDTGKLQAFTSSAAGEGLAYGRARHDSAVYFDDTCSAALVVAGGVGRLAGSTDPVQPLRQVERGSVNAYGQLAPFQVLQTATDTGERVANLLTEERLNAQVLSLANWIWVLGGMNGSGVATRSAERATILTAATAVGAGYVEDGGAGQLPAGRYHYRVSAVLPDGEQQRFSGEGLASRPISGRVSDGGALAIIFEAYPNAVAYRIYRSAAPGSGPGSARLVAFGNVGTAVDGRPGLLRWLDRGEGAAGAAPGNTLVLPRAGGTLAPGYWGYRITAVRPDGAGTRESFAGPAAVGHAEGTDLTLRVTWSPVPGATAYRVYRTAQAAATPDAANRSAMLLGEVTATEMVDDGSTALGTAPVPEGEDPLPRGALSRFAPDAQSAMVHARQGHEIVHVPMGNTLGQYHYYAVGGRDAERGNTLKDMEHATVTADGHLTWTAGSVNMTLPRAHFVLATNAGSRESPSCASVPQVVDPCSDPDSDADGYRRVECGGTDCDDSRPTSNPGSPELCQDGLDNDCDGLIDTADSDCEVPDAGVPADAGLPVGDAGPGTDASVTPTDAGPQLDCNDPAQADQDSDQYRRTECGGTDCNDTDPNVNPGVYESMDPAQGLCDNAMDDDCVGGDQMCIWGVFPTGPWAMTGPEEVYLLVAAGSEAVNGAGVESVIPSHDPARPYAEVAFVDPTGAIQEWLPVDAPSGYSGNGYGLEGLLYFNFLYVFGGNMLLTGQRIERTTSCLPSTTTDPTYAPECPTNVNSATWTSTTGLFTKQSSTASGMSTARVFFSRERIYSTVFVLGGLNGPTGAPIESFERAPE